MNNFTKLGTGLAAAAAFSGCANDNQKAQIRQEEKPTEIRRAENQADIDAREAKRAELRAKFEGPALAKEKKTNIRRLDLSKPDSKKSEPKKVPVLDISKDPRIVVVGANRNQKPKEEPLNIGAVKTTRLRNPALDIYGRRIAQPEQTPPGITIKRDVDNSRIIQRGNGTAHVGKVVIDGKVYDGN